MDKIIAYMQKSMVLSQATPAIRAELADQAHLKTLARGEHLFWDKGRVDYFYFVAEGYFSLYKLSAAGEKKVVFVYGPGEFLNEVMVQNLPASISCEAFSDGAVLAFPIPAFTAAMGRDFALAQAVMGSMATKIRRLYRQLKNTSGSVRGDKRLAAKLWKLSQDHGAASQKGTRIDLNLTVTYLADMLGAKRETVSRQLAQLSAQGLIFHENGAFIVPDRERLKDFFKDS